MSGVVWQVGEVVDGRYEVVEELGRGGGVVVHRVRHRGWGLDLAVRSLRPELAGDGRRRDELAARARAWVALGPHPNVCCCHYVRTVAGTPRLFCEYVPGASLADRIDARTLHRGDPDAVLARLLDVAVQLARGLGHAHAHGLVHGDITPTKVLLADDGTAKITDFGVPAGRRMSREADVHALAVTVLEMFGSGVLPRELEDRLRLCLRPEPMAAVATGLVELYGELLGRPYPRAAPHPLPPHADSLNNRALSLVDLDRVGQAEAAFAEAVAADPRHLPATYNLGLLRWRRGELTDTDLVASLDGFLVGSQVGDGWLARYLLAQVHLERDDATAARTHLDAALRLAPDIPELREAVAALPPVTGTGPVWEWQLPPEPARQLDGAGLVRYLSGLPARFAVTEPLLLVAHLDGTVRLWDLQTRQCRRELPGNGGPVHAVDLTADGRLAAACTGETVRWWDLTTDRGGRTLSVPPVLREQPAAEPAWTLRLAAGGRHLLCARGAAMVLWELPSGRVVTVHKGDRQLGFGQADLTGDGRYAVFAEAASARVWEVATGRGWQITDDSPTGGSDLDREPTLLRAGTRLVAAATRDHAIRLWDLADRRFVRSLIGHDGPVDALEWSADSGLLLSADARHLRVWDVASGQCVHSLPRPAGGMGVWDLRLDTPQPEHPQPDPLRLDGNDRTARTAGGEGVLRSWRLPQHERRAARYRLSRPTAPTELADRHARTRAWLKEARAALAAGRYRRAHELLSRVRSTPGHERTPEVLAAWRELSRHRTGLTRTGLRDAWPGAVLTVEHLSAADLSANGLTVATADVSGTLRVWSAADGTMLRQLTPDRGPAGRSGVKAVALRADGRRLAVASKDGTVALWSVTTGTQPRTVAARPEPAAIRFTGNGDRVLLRHRTGTVALVDLATGARLWTRSGATGRDPGTLWAAVDAPLAAFGGDGGQVSVVDTATGRDIHTVHTGHTSVDSVCLSPDGRLLLTVGRNPGSSPGRRTATLWETASGELLRRFGSGPLTGVLTADARFAVTADGDHTIRIWELDTGRCLQTLQGHHAILSGLAISADASRVLTAAHDRTARLWELDWDLST